MKSGWQTSKLSDVLAVLRNGVNCKQDKTGTGDKISRIESISDASFDLEKVGYAELSAHDRARYRLQPGDILFSHINSAAHVGKTAVFDSAERVYHGVNLLLMRPKAVITSAYLDYALKSLFQGGYWRGVCKQSVNQASVNQQDISRVEVSYPKSLPEQQRIVGILEEAFEGIATAKTNAEKNLQNARALFDSHLDAVFSKRGAGWVEKKLGDICERVSVGHVGPTSQFYCEADSGIPFLRSQNVRPGCLDFVGLRYVTKEFHMKLKKSQLRAGDLVFVRVGANRANCCSIPEGLGEINCANIVFARPTEGNAAYLEQYCQSPDGQRQLLGMTTGSAQGVINTSSVARMVVPIPPAAEQRRIVDKLAELSTHSQCLESIYQRKLATLERLKKSLLNQAFTGAL
jgi:type I restriction enzyme S subunit